MGFCWGEAAGSDEIALEGKRHGGGGQEAARARVDGGCSGDAARSRGRRLFRRRSIAVDEGRRRRGHQVRGDRQSSSRVEKGLGWETCDGRPSSITAPRILVGGRCHRKLRSVRPSTAHVMRKLAAVVQLAEQEILPTKPTTPPSPKRRSRERDIHVLEVPVASLSGNVKIDTVLIVDSTAYPHLKHYRIWCLPRC